MRTGRHRVRIHLRRSPGVPPSRLLEELRVVEPVRDPARRPLEIVRLPDGEPAPVSAQHLGRGIFFENRFETLPQFSPVDLVPITALDLGGDLRYLVAVMRSAIIGRVLSVRQPERRGRIIQYADRF